MAARVGAAVGIVGGLLTAWLVLRVSLPLLDGTRPRSTGWARR